MQWRSLLFWPDLSRQVIVVVVVGQVEVAKLIVLLTSPTSLPWDKLLLVDEEAGKIGVIIVIVNLFVVVVE